MALTKIDDRGLKTPIDLLDSEEIRLGTGNDLKIYHDGTNSYIDDTGTGNLILKGTHLNLYSQNNSEAYITCIENGAVSLYYNDVKKLETTSGGGTLTGDWTVTNDLFLADDGELVLGTGGDLKLYHNGSDSYIVNNTGGLHLWGGGDGTTMTIRPKQGENSIVANANGSVDLYYDNVKQFETIDGGVRVADSKEIQAGNVGDLKIYHDGSNSYVRDDGVGDLILKGSEVRIQSGNSTDTKALFNNDGAVQLYYDNVKTFETTSSGIKVLGPDTGSATIDLYSDEGQHGADMFRLHVDDGGPFYLKNYKDGAWENSIAVTGAGSVDLYYDNVKKFETTSNGIKTSGRAEIDGNCFPYSDNNSDLGLSANRWQDLYLSNSIYLGGTGSANALSDYEEGTWTPAGNSTCPTLNVSSGRYIKVGTVCMAWWQVEFGTDGSSGHAWLTGLPFTSKNAAPWGGSTAWDYRTESTINAHVSGNTDRIYFYHDDGSSAHGEHTKLEGKQFRACTIYQVA